MNTDSIPATPVYTVTLTASGSAAIDGEELDGAAGRTPDEARVAALAEIKIKAAFHGRPVRATAKEADGIVYHLIVAPDGAVTTLDQPHPTPPAPRRAPAAERPAHPAAVDPPARPVGPPEQLPQPASDPTPAPAAMTGEWAAPLPSDMTYRLQWAQLVRQEQAGALAEAIITADRIETALTEQYGPQHPHTVNVLTVRAWLTLRAGGELAELVELLIETAERRQEAKAPAEDTLRAIRNAHVLWRYLTGEDAVTARELAESLLVLLDLDDDGRRARDVVRWVESGGAALGAA
ncbi:hypothetical protein [Streptomyces violascens]|uniref:hypothetical protein n=1 Tax=Streptomyces violascens TaxID=67381 RepID=UPI001672E73A|nr:hypothetical protein [Streptomyces violascens]GGU50006.1 hypothetical protein GCM10010289_83130 [Streptomyces violascens]